MYSCDTNILLYAFDLSCKEHSKARLYLEKMSSNEEFVICDLVLAELYVLLRNSKVVNKPLSAKNAQTYCRTLRSNPNWQVLEYTLGVMGFAWQSSSNFSQATQIYDYRLGLVLKRHGVQEFATRNIKDFKSIGFNKLINPIDD